MNRDDARAILRRWANIDDEIKIAEQAYKKKCDEIDIVAMIPSPVQQLSGMPHQSKIAKNTERVALRRIEIAEAHREELERLNNAVIDAMKFRSKVNNILLLCSIDGEAVIRCRYEKHMTMPETCKELIISNSEAWREEERVLNTICEEWT